MLPLVLALALQAAVPAQPPAVAADARCIVVLGFVGSRGTPEQQAAAQRGVMFFVGKLRGRDAAIDVGRAVARAAEAAKAAGLNAQAEGNRCDAEFTAAAQSLRTVSAPNTP